MAFSLNPNTSWQMVGQNVLGSTAQALGSGLAAKLDYPSMSPQQSQVTTAAQQATSAFPPTATTTLFNGTSTASSSGTTIAGLPEQDWLYIGLGLAAIYGLFTMTHG